MEENNFRPIFIKPHKNQVQYLSISYLKVVNKYVHPKYIFQSILYMVVEEYVRKWHFSAIKTEITFQ